MQKSQENLKAKINSIIWMIVILVLMLAIVTGGKIVMTGIVGGLFTSGALAILYYRIAEKSNRVRRIFQRNPILFEIIGWIFGAVIILEAGLITGIIAGGLTHLAMSYLSSYEQRLYIENNS